MKKAFFPFLVLLILATVGSFSFFFFQKEKANLSSGIRQEGRGELKGESVEGDEIQSKILQSETGGVIHEVKLLMDRAEPDTLTVKVGEKIQFNSADGRSHRIGQGDGADPDAGNDHDHPEISLNSGTFGPDEGYLVTILAPGVYSFHDHLDPRLFVTVVAYVPEESNEVNPAPMPE